MTQQHHLLQSFAVSSLNLHGCGVSGFRKSLGLFYHLFSSEEVLADLGCSAKLCAIHYIITQLGFDIA